MYEFYLLNINLQGMFLQGMFLEIMKNINLAFVKAKKPSKIKQ